MLKSKVTINIKGKNIERFIHRLVNQRIELIKIDYISGTSSGSIVASLYAMRI